jgi:shikimate kinase
MATVSIMGSFDAPGRLLLKPWDYWADSVLSVKFRPSHISRKPNDNVNLYIVGFMGTGKSTVARVLANRLGMLWLDSDVQIEKDQGKPIPEIFASAGEAVFRKMELDFIESGHPERGAIISCGGGLVIQPGMVERLNTKGVVVCLLASPDSIFERTKSNRNRPLLNVPDPRAKIAEMLETREPFYRRAGTQILTDHRSMIEVAMHVSRVYLREAREFRQD